MACAIVSGPVLAEGWSVGFGVGVTQVDDQEGRDGITLDDNALGLRVIVGYEASEYFAIEGTYAEAGEADGELARFGIDFPPPLEFDADVKMWTLSIVGKLALSESTHVFGKAGYFDGEINDDLGGFPESIDIEEDGLTLGVGIGWAMASSLELRGSFDWYDTDIDTLQSATVSIHYRFGE